MGNLKFCLSTSCPLDNKLFKWASRLVLPLLLGGEVVVVVEEEVGVPLLVPILARVLLTPVRIFET